MLPREKTCRFPMPGRRPAAKPMGAADRRATRGAGTRTGLAGTRHRDVASSVDGTRATPQTPVLSEAEFEVQKARILHR
jgi:hypothetical protein